MNENEDENETRLMGSNNMSSVSETLINKEEKPGLVSLLSSDSGFKSQDHMALSSSSTSSVTASLTTASADREMMEHQMSGSSDESVPIMVDCHSSAKTGVKQTDVSITNGRSSRSEDDMAQQQNHEQQQHQQQFGSSSCEIKPIPIKKSLGELVDEEKNLADGSSNFKPTGAVFKSLSINKLSISPSGLIKSLVN